MKCSGKKIKVLDWELLDPQVPASYDIRSYVNQCQKLLDDRLYQSDVHAYVLEQQSFRPTGFGRAIPGAVIKSSMFEAVLMAILMERVKESKVLIESVMPGSS